MTSDSANVPGTAIAGHVRKAADPPVDFAVVADLLSEKTIFLTRTVDASVVSVGDEVTYTVAVTNNSGKELIDVGLDDQLLGDGVEILGFSSIGAEGCRVGGEPEVTCTISSLKNGATATLKVRCKYSQTGEKTNLGMFSQRNPNGSRNLSHTIAIVARSIQVR